jgi:adenosyl cobinamide kinase/adenosyl cobinamide phosphate guanylyltransferase
VTLVLYLGGARSGKSRLALARAEGAVRPLVFIATGEPGDDEMAQRIALHRAERSAEWQTVEEPIEVEQALHAAPPDATVVLDCLSLWVANVLETHPVEELAAAGAAAAGARPGLTVAVSNEVGLGIVPMHPVGRRYRDALGRVNTIWADAADEAYLVVAGRTLRLS